jgi:lysophospholipase L1-like esterase
VLGEMLLVVAQYRYSPLKIVRRADPKDLRFEHTFDDPDFVWDPEFLWRPRKGFDCFNAAGYRGRDLGATKAPGTIRLLAVGDSNTLGHHGADGASWPLLMEQLDPRLSVINAGVYGYSSFQGLRRLREALSLNPDVVLVSFGGNDAQPVRFTDAQYARVVARRMGLLGWSTRFRVGELLLAGIDKATLLGRRDGERVTRVSIEEYGQNIREMIQVCRRQRATVFLLTRPFVGDSGDPRSWMSHAPPYNEATRRVATEEGIGLLDVYAQFSSRPELFEDESHFTPQGHWLAAQYVYAEIKSAVDLAISRVAAR